MPIEFRCPNCTKLLRTPDESAGKKAKCPQCSNIVDVPASSGPAAGTAGEPNFGSPTSQPPAGPSPFSDRTESYEPTSPFATRGDAVNPYASPAAVSKQDAIDRVPTGDLVYHKLSFDLIWSNTWDIFSANIGPCALVGLVVLGINIGLGVLGQVTNAPAELTGELAIVVIAQLVNQVISLLVQTWVQLGLTAFAIKLARTGHAEVNDFFAVGRFFGRGLGGMLLLYVLFVGVILIGLLPGAAAFIASGGPRGFENDPALTLIVGGVGLVIAIGVTWWIYFRLLLFYAFIVDRNEGVIESFRSSDRFMRGNKLTAFLVLLVVGILGVLFTCVTCFIGSIFFYPYIGVVTAVVYLMATGQPLFNPKQTVQPYA